MHKVELREDPPVGCQMVELRESPMMVSQDLGSKTGGGYPCKWCCCQLCTEGACMGKACCGNSYKHK